jgi:chemotaxis protein CheY-P-specific phosphatase CheC
MDYNIEIIRRPEVTDLAGEKVMIDFETGKYYMLKGVANDIWDLMENGITVTDITESLMKEYEVDQEICLKSVNEFFKSLVNIGFVKLSLI